MHGSTDSSAAQRSSLAMTCACLFLASASILQFCARSSAQSPPNVVYILADDMGFGDIRSYNATSPVNTPNLDRIANAGMRFTDAHSLSSVCTPTRYGVLTGQYSWRTSLQSSALLPYQPALIASQRITVAEMLKASNYSTGAFGKWHLGMNWVTTGGGAALQNGANVNHAMPFTGGPLDNGFDTYFGVDAANYPPYAFIRDRNTVGNNLVTPTSPTGQVTGNPSAPFNAVGPIVPGYDQTNALPTVVNEAVSYISSKANQANPFFAYLPLTAPHVPILPPSSASGQSGVTGPKQAYGDFIWAVDSVVGQVLDALEDPNNDGNQSDSIRDNTLVIFTADNGADKLFSFSTSAGAIGGTPIRGEKGMIYEGGTRVPFLAQWPDQIPAGTINNHNILLNDLMATMAGITGYTFPANAAEDSVNIMPELTGSATTPVRTTTVTHSFQGAFAIRQTDSGDNEWKLIFTPGDGGYNDFQKVDPKALITDFTKLQLYNLKSDPGEQSNLLAGGGSAAMQQKALQLQGILQDYLYSGRSVNIPPRTGTNGETTMLIDFGSDARQTSATGWNNVSGPQSSRPVVAMGLYDQGGGYTGIVLKTSWNGSGTDSGVGSLFNAYDGPYPSEVSAYPSSALSDTFYVRNGNTLTITLESLDAHATYDFLFYAGASSGPEYALYTVAGSTMQQAHIAPLVNNSTMVAAIDGIMADAQNRIQILVEGRHLDGSLGGSGWLNFLRVVEHLLEIPGDYNNDRLVDVADYATWRSAFGTTGANSADGNHDGIVDTGDYVIWRRALADWSSGSGAGSWADASAVPEPSSLLSLIMGLASLFAASRRRCRSW
jgi:arylsulfatase A-like enzyme